MGCTSSKSTVQEIEIKDGKVRKASGKRIKVASSDEAKINENNAVLVNEKSKSAKSRDSGISEMDEDREKFITESSDPNLVQGIENETRPKTPELLIFGRQFQSRSAGRARSKAILEELEAEGLISGTKVEKGGAAFNVSIGPMQHLEPLAPIKRPPPRLERLKSERQLPSKEQLEKKMKQAEDRRKETLQRRSRLASQLSRDQAMAAKFNSDRNTENIVDETASTSSQQDQIDFIDKSQNKTVFDNDSVDSMEDAISPGVMDSNDDFYKDITPSSINSFS